MKINVYLHKNDEEISYGELWKDIKSKKRKYLPRLTRARMVVNELNKLLPLVCRKQRTMYYYYEIEMKGVK